jgi:hypothetical protein
MIKCFAYRGNKSLLEAKKACLDKMIFKVKDESFAHKMCRKKWPEINYKLFVFENYNNNETFKELIND